MKNIHVLPTDKPSNLVQKRITKEIKFSSLDNPQVWNNVNIYITSDEEIKKGDWFSTSNNKILKCEKVLMGLIYSEGDYGRNPNGCQKIILTTDQDLIADGVQAIDDEFLEWFVKNPSCEFVEVKKEKIVLGEVSGTTYTDFKYKLIIPKEQQKQHLIDMMRSDEELGLYDEQETLEEVAKNYANYNEQIHNAIKEAVKFGAKWQQQQNKNLYSEEDLEQAHFEGKLKKQSFKEWFNQFKKQ